jgi:hypothetical protein
LTPIYSILESPYRWNILASASFVTGVVGAVVIITYNWSHWFGRVWFLFWLAASLLCVARLVIEWKRRVDADLLEAARRQTSTTGTNSQIT